MGVQFVSQRDYNQHEEADIAILQNLNHGCRVGMVLISGTILMGATTKFIDEPVIRLGVQFFVLCGTLYSNYIVTTNSFSTRIK